MHSMAANTPKPNLPHSNTTLTELFAWMNNFCRFLFTSLLSLLHGATAQITAQVTDTIPPKVACKPPFNVDACNTIGYTWIQAISFVESLSDDTPPTDSLRLGIRKKCTGDGFPDGKTALMFTSNEIGNPTEIEVWAKDKAGNTALCRTHVYLVDFGTCDPSYSINIYFPKNLNRIQGVDANVDKVTCQNDSNHLHLTFPLQAFGTLSRPGDLLFVTPSKSDHPLNGVSTYDLALISKYILGLATLSPYQLIAADANEDGKVTAFDIVLLRQLILGIITELPKGASWRFIPYDYQFPDPGNPFSPPFPTRIEVPRSADPSPNYFGFFGVKIGDVNFSADLK